MKRKQKTKTVNRLLLSSIPLLLLLFFTGMPENSTAQQITPTVVSSGGETLTGSNLLLDFTIGEITTETLSATGLSLTQGFMQGPDRNTGIEEMSVDENAVVIYPNPVTDRLYLQYRDLEPHPVTAEIKDLQGRTILRSAFNMNPLVVNLEKLSPGFYTATIIFKNHQTITKKLIKR